MACGTDPIYELQARYPVKYHASQEFGQSQFSIYEYLSAGILYEVSRAVNVFAQKERALR